MFLNSRLFVQCPTACSVGAKRSKGRESDVDPFVRHVFNIFDEIRNAIFGFDDNDALASVLEQQSARPVVQRLSCSDCNMSILVHSLVSVGVNQCLYSTRIHRHYAKKRVGRYVGNEPLLIKSRYNETHFFRVKLAKFRAYSLVATATAETRCLLLSSRWQLGEMVNKTTEMDSVSSECSKMTNTCWISVTLFLMIGAGSVRMF